MENLILDNEVVTKSKDDWFYYAIKDKEFDGAGDMSKLTFLLSKFREIIEQGRV